MRRDLVGIYVRLTGRVSCRVRLCMHIGFAKTLSMQGIRQSGTTAADCSIRTRSVASLL